MRKKFETKEDRERELKLATALARVWDYSAVKMPEQYRVDFVFAHMNRIKAFAEVKCRTYARGDFPTYMMSLAKFEAGMRWCGFCSCPFLLVVGWRDGAGIVKVNDSEVLRAIRFGIGGRTDRDGKDIEPMIYVPIEFFTRDLDVAEFFINPKGGA